MINEFRGQYRFLSNFYPCLIEFEGNVYISVEHAFQAAKTLDEDWRESIFWARTPSDAKRIGRKVPLREDWEEIKLSVMENLLRQKFNIFDFKSALLATGDEELIEGNWWGDTFWGVCNGQGENHLGKLLMKIRSEIRANL